MATSEIRAWGHPFYRVLNRLWSRTDLTRSRSRSAAVPGVLCAESRSLGVYFRMLMVGCLEGLSSERGIAWRCGLVLASQVSRMRTSEELAGAFDAVESRFNNYC